jgi:hypothetical protein
MILLITASVHAEECATALQRATRKKIVLAADFRSAFTHLREEEFSAVVIDESLLETRGSLESLLKNLGAAAPVFVNLAVSRAERLVRDVVAALRRVEQERYLARKAAEWELRGALKSELTGILLSTEQALAAPSLPAGVESKLRSVHELAQKMRAQLDSPGN